MRMPVLALIGALLVVGTADAAEWTEVASGSDRRVEIDRASILQSDPGTKVAWGRMVMKDQEVAAAGYKSVKALNRYDCRNGSFMTIKRVYLDGDEHLVREERVVDPKSMTVAPGSVDERMLSEVCGNTSGDPIGGTAAHETPAAADKPHPVAEKSATSQPPKIAEAEAPPAANSAAAPPKPEVLSDDIRPQVIRPLSQAQKEAAVQARLAALAYMAERKAAAAGAKPLEEPAAAPPVAAKPESHKRPQALPHVAVATSRSTHRKADQPAEAVAGPIHWSYSGPGGPDRWAELKPEFALCGRGERQSPIDVADGIRVDLEPIQFDYRPTYFRIEDNGHTVRVDVGEGSSIRVMGRTYDLVQFHFHRPSEFRINGRGFDMEAHLVHRDLDGRLAVVSVMLERGSALPIVQTLWNNLPLEPHQSYVPEVAIDPGELLPNDRGYAIFMGSLTTPPCTEGVLWMVMREPVQVAADQVSVFARLHPMNARPLQALAGRLVKLPR